MAGSRVFDLTIVSRGERKCTDKDFQMGKATLNQSSIIGWKVDVLETAIPSMLYVDVPPSILMWFGSRRVRRLRMFSRQVTW